MKLKSKIHLYSSVMFAALLIIMNLSIYVAFSGMSIDSGLDETEAKTETTAERLRQSAGSIPEADLLRAYVPLDGMLRIVTQDGNNAAMVTSSSELELSKRPALYYPRKHVEVVKEAGHTYTLVSVPVIWMEGEVVNVQVMESLQATMDNLDVLRTALMLVTAIALIPVVLSGRLLGSLIMRPITAMTTTMRDIKGSGTFKRLEQDGKSKDELKEMGDTFNEMIELLESNYDKQKRFVSNASHELKTPLTVIESYSSLLLRRGKERPELLEESLRAIHSEAVRMKEMTEQLLLLAKHKEQWNIELQELDLVQLAEESARAFRSAYDREVNVSAELRPVMAHTDQNKLKQLLFIFLDNARKYSDEGITITVERHGDRGRIRITDRGIGIPKEDLSKVFDRFFRVDQARSRKTGGVGLGLSLAQEIAAAIGIVVALDSLEGVGTTVTLTLENVPVEGKK
ncbi:sensor histidine kinase [Paenibacillus chungangensis]|uniref:histidine kinase n=1 Tax=Paenibacillus chungangensis TaxID=696535 RepID=A0ABW3HL46_9BACL